MAEAKLNFDEDTLDKESGVYALYSRLYEGMRNANSVDAPSFTNDPPLDEQGNIDNAAIAKLVEEYSDILMKNSAYLFANSIITVVGSSGSGGGSASADCISRNGDSMVGPLNALYGFKSGDEGTCIFETYVDSKDKSHARITGSLKVSEDVTIDGVLNLSDSGIYFDNKNSICSSEGRLCIVGEDIAFTGAISVDGSITLGTILIDSTGIYANGKEFYHAGNSNKADVDWTMYNANVHGDLHVYQDATIDGQLSIKKGIFVDYDDKKILSTEVEELKDEQGEVTGVNVTLLLSTDLSLFRGCGILFERNKILSVQGGDDSRVILSAPNMVLNIGCEVTEYISLQSDIYDNGNNYRIISKNGDGNFKNSLSAGCGNAGSNVLQTYFIDEDDCGVDFNEKVRFGVDKLALWGDDTGKLIGSCPYIHVSDGKRQTEQIKFYVGCSDTTSPFRDQSAKWSATLLIGTDAEFIAFEKPVEAHSFAIKSELYKTRLIENALFFGDGKFIEGLTDGIRYSGNAYFDGSLSSPSFASGFAGYGWAIREDQYVGGYAATFDELTVRKKMRVYELEVQKISVTNGSLWVSDSCSGDEVREIA